MTGDFSPHLTSGHNGPLHPVEAIVLSHMPSIEAWFRKKWKATPPPLTSSVDLRHAGFKLAPVDTNLFPAGYNNLNPEFLPLCVQAVQSFMAEFHPDCTNVLLIPENHTRNTYYRESFSILKGIWHSAGFVVQVGTLDETVHEPTPVLLPSGEQFLISPISREGNRLKLPGFTPCFIVLNNDLSSGIPPVLESLEQLIRPPVSLGWSTRLKSTHFHFFEKIAEEFSEHIGIDPWFINPYFTKVDGIDFMAQNGLDTLADAVDTILAKIQEKYRSYGIKEKPFAVVKSDNGTYGMSVMMVQTGDTLRGLNRKMRTKMASSKGSRSVDKVIIQEGVYTFETMPNGAVAEPVVYMIGQYVVGGFYRVHQGRGSDENLNAPGMHFEPLAFEKSCNMPNEALTAMECPNRFYVYGVIARLAALAAAEEMKAIEEKV